ncbi:butyrophilin subfamily 3 member A2-like [Centroberyx affinis]|uniref:butyrophilin subfamily 3 member A2-like n=1 Tax=Centroberyx affinis TaxID=166261 RepID=UPI003A5C3209
MRRVSVMFGRILLAVGLFSACAVLGESNENDSPETVFAFVGEDVTLPCLYKSGVSVETVEWKKVGLQPKDVYVHRDGCETFEMKNEAYEFRTHLFMRELKNGNISLRLSDVQLSDAGKYRCLTFPKENQTLKFIELVVVSKPIILITGIDSGGATLQCEVNCSFPEPEITWLDDQGNNITAPRPRSNSDGSNCYTLRSTVTVQPTATNRFTCRVRQQTTSRTVDTKIEISADCMKSCTQNSVLSVVMPVLAVLVTLALLAEAFIAWKRRAEKSDKQKLPLSRQPSDESTENSTTDDQSLLQKRDKALEDRDCTILQLKSQMADLWSQLRDKDETICSLTEQRDRLQSFEREHRVVCQHGQPTIGTKSPLDSPKPCNPPPDRSPKARNLTHDNQTKGPKADFTRHDSNPTPSSPSHNKSTKPRALQDRNDPPYSNPPNSNNPNHSTSDISKGAAASSSSVSDNPSEQKPKCSVHSRSVSFSLLRPGSNVSTRPSRHSSLSISSNNRFSVLADSDPESEVLIS